METFPFFLNQTENKGEISQVRLLVDFARPEESAEILQFLVEHYIPSTPLNRIYQLDETGVDDETLKLRRERPWIGDGIRASSEKKLTLVVRDETARNQLVAVAMNLIVERTDDLITWTPGQRKTSQLLIAVMEALSKDVDIFTKYQTDRIVRLLILSVHPQYGRQGIATKLIRLSQDLAQSHGAGALEIEALNKFAARAASACGLETISTVDYASLEMDGKKPLASYPALLAEHPDGQLMACRIPRRDTADGFPLNLEWAGIDSPLVIDFAKPDQLEEIFLFVKEHFMDVAPCAQIFAVDLATLSSEEYQKKVDSFCGFLVEECLRPPLSLTVRDPSQGGQIAAVVLNYMEYRPAAEKEKPIEEEPILMDALREALIRNLDLFALYGTDKVLHWYMVAVSAQYGRRGLATKLLELTEELAVRNGAGAVKALAISEYAARAAVKRGFTTLNSVAYATLEYKGTRPLADCQESLGDHTTARFMALRL